MYPLTQSSIRPLRRSDGNTQSRPAVVREPVVRDRCCKDKPERLGKRLVIVPRCQHNGVSAGQWIRAVSPFVEDVVDALTPRPPGAHVPGAGGVANTNPTVTITSITGEAVYQTTANPITMSGSMSDNGTITGVTRTNNQTGGTVACTVDSQIAWTCPHVPLVQNVITR